MDKKTRIINIILLNIMGICILPLMAYGLIYVYNFLGLDIFNGTSFKSNFGDLILFIVIPISLIIIAFYYICLARYTYYQYSDDLDNLDENEIIEDTENNKKQ